MKHLLLLKHSLDIWHKSLPDIGMSFLCVLYSTHSLFRVLLSTILDLWIMSSFPFEVWEILHVCGLCCKRCCISTRNVRNISLVQSQQDKYMNHTRITESLQNNVFLFLTYKFSVYPWSRFRLHQFQFWLHISPVYILPSPQPSSAEYLTEAINITVRTCWYIRRTICTQIFIGLC